MRGAIGSVDSTSARSVAAVLAVLDAGSECGFVITATKLAKLLYFADLESVKRGGDPISGLEWRWRKFGPFDNTLVTIERELIEQGWLTSEPYYESGRRLRLVPSRHDYGYIDILGTHDLEIIRLAVRRFGQYAAVTIRDLSYRTPPMVDAQARGRESVLNLELVRPVPKFRGAVTRARAVLARLDDQQDDPEAQDEIMVELDELAEERTAATARLLGDG
jgi:uncharacterized phage-associated protein